MKTSRKVLVIGAGPGSLAVSLLLASQGIEVKIIERLPRVGGRCSALEANGFRFDLGPTFFLYPLVLERIFHLIGRDLQSEIPMIRLEPQYRIVFGDNGGYLQCSPDIEEMEKAISKISPIDSLSFRTFMNDNREKMERFRPALESSFSSWLDLFRMNLLKMLPILRPWNSVDRDLARYFRDPRIRLAFSFQSKYLGMSPFRCPSLFTILSFLEYEYGVFHPIGGCSAVSEKMAKIAQEMGVDISLENSVEEILFEKDRAIGVRTSQGTYFADAIIINADFANSMQKLVPNHLRKRWNDRQLAKKKYSCSTFMMYLGVEGTFPELEHHTIYTSSDYHRNLRDIEDNHILSEDPSFYIQNACITDPSLAPPNCSTLYILAPVTHQHSNVDWSKETKPFRNKMIHQLKKVGIKDIEKRIQFEKIITPSQWEFDYQIYRGATFNLAHNWQQMLHLRPRNRFEDLKSVYLVGGGTHPGSGLPVIYESARITSRLLLQDWGMDHEWLDRPTAKKETCLVPV